MADYIDWPGNSSTYRYWFLDTPATPSSIQNVAGNYMFVRPTNNGWVPVYIGIADDLSSRIPFHDRWSDAAAAGATRVMGHTNSDAAKRSSEERDLIGYWNPPLNIQHRKAGKGFGG